MKAGNDREVHPENAGNEGWGQKYDAENGKDFNDLILLQGNKVHQCVLEVFQPLEIETCVLQKGGNVLQNDF